MIDRKEIYREREREGRARERERELSKFIKIIVVATGQIDKKIVHLSKLKQV